MFELTQEAYLKKLEKIKIKNIQKEYRLNLFKEKIRLFHFPKFETSKLIAIYLFILLNAVIIYAMIAMWQFADLTYLGVLISDIAAQVLIYAIYCLKAYHGKKQEELLKFNKEQFNNNIQYDQEAVG